MPPSSLIEQLQRDNGPRTDATIRVKSVSNINSKEREKQKEREREKKVQNYGTVHSMPSILERDAGRFGDTVGAFQIDHTRYYL